jgi:hypothetical protein
MGPLRSLRVAGAAEPCEMTRPRAARARAPGCPLTFVKGRARRVCTEARWNPQTGSQVSRLEEREPTVGPTHVAGPGRGRRGRGGALNARALRRAVFLGGRLGTAPGSAGGTSLVTGHASHRGAPHTRSPDGSGSTSALCRRVDVHGRGMGMRRRARNLIDTAD